MLDEIYAKLDELEELSLNNSVDTDAIDRDNLLEKLRGIYNAIYRWEIKGDARISHDKKMAQEVDINVAEEEKFQIEHQEEESIESVPAPLQENTLNLGINDRFRIIEELFENDANAFNALLTEVKEIEHFESAWNHVLRTIGEIDLEEKEEILNIFMLVLQKSKEG